MTSIYINWHLGLGDAIICAPIAVKYASMYEKVYVPAYDHNTESVKSFFVNYPNIEVVPHYLKVRAKVLNLGAYNKDLPLLPGESFDEWFYRVAGMEIEDKKRFNPFSVLSGKPTLENWMNYAFVHDDESRGFKINRNHITDGLSIFFPENKGGSVLSFSARIRYASEIHCIDSSFLHLCDALPTTGKLYWHQYARRYEKPLHDVKLTKDWIIIK